MQTLDEKNTVWDEVETPYNSDELIDDVNKNASLVRINHVPKEVKLDLNSDIDSEAQDDIMVEEDIEEASIDIHLGLVVSPDEYTPEYIEIIKNNLISQRNIKFCSEQFKDRTISYNIVDVDVMPDAVTALLNEVIDDNNELNKTIYPNSVSIVLDIGYGTTDMASIQGFDIISDSEKQFNIGANDAFTDIAQEVESRYNCGYIDASMISNVVKSSLGVCEQCGSVSGSGKVCACGGTMVMKRNMIKIGQMVFDISDIVNTVFHAKTDNISNLFKRYIDTLFKVRGINNSALETVLIVGGGAELFGNMLKDKISEYVGEFVNVKKSQKAVWKSVSGLSKYILMKKSKSKKNFNYYAFLDIGNFATKAKLTDVNGGELGKPVELLTKISTPVNQSSITLRKVHPMMDLHLQISSADNVPHLGDGQYFVSHMASKGRNIKVRNSLIPKPVDEIVYVMINSAIGVLLARHL